MRALKTVLIFTLSFLLIGCAQTEISLNEEDALEVALDNESLNEEDITDKKIKKNGDSYTITFNTKDGAYTYVVGTNGILQGKKFVPVETEEEESKEEEKKEESTNKATKPQSEKRIVEFPEEISNQDANNAYSAALSQLGIQDGYVQYISIKEDGNNYVVRLRLTNGDSTTYKVVVDKGTFTVKEWSQE